MLPQSPLAAAQGAVAAGGCAAPHPGHATGRAQARARPLDWSGTAMGTGRLALALLPGLILLSLSPAERCDGAAGVFMEPQLRARAGDSVLLPCLFLDPHGRGWTLLKVDWLHKAGAGTQVSRDSAGRGGDTGVDGRGGRGRQQWGSSRGEDVEKPIRRPQAVRRGSFHGRKKKGPRVEAGRPRSIPGAFPGSAGLCECEENPRDRQGA